ncbi:MAG: hypothetical protein HY273_12910 [Gammaproteobacteria bacterium]|nr:hypothetical protein [Gammaproteobacteria bacterium]
MKPQKTLVFIVVLLTYTQANANCQEFLNEIKPYQLAYSRATTIFQQQAALTSIEIIQRQYLGDGCKFKLDAYDEQVRAERINAIKEQEKKDAVSAAVEKKNRLEQEKKNAASAAVEKKKKREQEAKLEVYNTCIEGLRFDSHRASIWKL